MAHQLYVLQVLTFNLLEERMMTKMDPNDQVRNEQINFSFIWYKILLLQIFLCVINAVRQM